MRALNLALKVLGLRIIRPDTINGSGIFINMDPVILGPWQITQLQHHEQLIPLMYMAYLE